MKVKRDKYTREDGRPTFAFWCGVNRMLKQIHEDVEATKAIRKEIDELKIKNDQSFERLRQTMQRFDSAL